uniref:WGS project CAEQ00000000 data, annotated contig 1707 n=1 Tax=Trypanosoma congolense (strain IL3000) TaxID=1068625 RepID=F9W851_TRYCI|nr:unnamed protein product [Trypanosoma congolense IL3000]
MEDTSCHGSATAVVHSEGDTESRAKEAGSLSAPLLINNSIALQDLPAEYNVSTVVECDASGHVQPRAVALDSPNDVLHHGRYYIPRRDIKNLARKSRVTFRGNVSIREFDATSAVVPYEENRAAHIGNTDMVPGLVGCDMQSYKRKRECAVVEVGEGNDIFDGISVKNYRFVPFMGDLYNDGRQAMIQLQDVKNFCESVELDVVEFNERHTRAERMLAEAKRLLECRTSVVGNGHVNQS